VSERNLPHTQKNDTESLVALPQGCLKDKKHKGFAIKVSRVGGMEYEGSGGKYFDCTESCVLGHGWVGGAVLNRSDGTKGK